MFNLYKNKLKIKNIFINSHTIKKFIERNKGYKKIEIPTDSELILFVQRYKKNIRIDELKGVIDLGNELYAIVNVYENIQTEEYSMKVLTILTHFQMSVSNNMGFGNRLEESFQITFTNVKKEESFFNYDEYRDVIKNIYWMEDNVIHPWIEIGKTDADAKIIHSDKVNKILRLEFKKDGQNVNIVPS